MLGHAVARNPAPALRNWSVARQVRIGPIALGNAVGESLARGSVEGSQHEEDRGTVYRDGDVARSELRIGAPDQPDSPAIDRFVGAFGDGYLPPVDRSNDVLLADASGASFGRGRISISPPIDRKVYITDDLAGLSNEELLARGRALLAGPSAAAPRRAGSGELSASVLYQQGYGDIRESVSVSSAPSVPVDPFSSLDSALTFESPALAALPSAQPGVVLGTAMGVAEVIADIPIQAALNTVDLAKVAVAMTPTLVGLSPLDVNLYGAIGRQAQAGRSTEQIVGARFQGLMRLPETLTQAYREGNNVAGGQALGQAAMMLWAPRPSMPRSPAALVELETAALQRIAANNRAGSPAAARRQAYLQARGQMDFRHIEADVVLNQAGGLVKAHGGHFPNSPRTHVIRDGTERWAPNGVGYAKVKLLGPDGNWYLKTNNLQDRGFASLTPEAWSFARAKGEMSQAWLNRVRDPVDGKWTGESSGVEFRFFPPNNHVQLWRGYPLEP